MATRSGRFSATTHVPRYSRLLWDTVRSPVVVYFFLAGNLLLVTASLAFYAVEVGTNPAVNHWLDGLWWGLATITTVGFGDIVPQTGAGRLIAMALIASGVVMFVGSTALITSSFFARTREDIIELEGQTQADWEHLRSELAAIRAEIARLDASRQAG